MLWTKHLAPGNCNLLLYEDYEDSPAHVELTERLRKTLYYGKAPASERHSLPVTELAVEFFQDAAPRQLGQLDTYVAASFSRRACMSPSALMLSMIYIERLKHKNPEYLQKVSSADLFLISMMVASKYLYDEGIDEEVFNDEWAQSGNLEIDDLNELERNFLGAIEWHLYVSVKSFWAALLAIERELALRKGWEHGFYTYCDAWVLTDRQMAEALAALLRTFLKVVVVCSVAYVGCILSIVGATVTLSCVQHHAPTAVTILTQDSPASRMPGLPIDVTAKLPVFHPPPLDVLPAAHARSSLPFDDPPTDETLRTIRSPFVSEPGKRTGPDVTMGTMKSKHSRKRTNEKSNTLTNDTHTRGLSSILTLTLLKDTFLQFMTAVQEKLSMPVNDCVSPGCTDRVPPVCTCGACMVQSTLSCWNETISAPEVDRTCRRQAASFDDSRLVFLADQDSAILECHGGIGHRCCCSQDFGVPWQPGASFNPPVYDAVHSFSTASFLT